MGSFEEYWLMSKNPHVVVDDSGGRPDFSGPLLPTHVREQVRKVLMATVGHGMMADRAWRTIVGRYEYEMGKDLPRPGGVPMGSAVERFIAGGDAIEVLDVIALALLWAKNIDAFDTPAANALYRRSFSPQQGIDEVNRFFREAEVPYQFERDAWVHVPSGHVHAEIVRPALDVLARPGFEGALDEFTKALSHARDGNTKEAATEATKAVESTMKCICDVRGWKYARDATATTMFKVVTDQGLIPAWLEGSLLGPVPIRNAKAAHGQGSKPERLPAFMARLAVNLAGSSILALMAAHDAPR